MQNSNVSLKVTEEQELHAQTHDIHELADIIEEDEDMGKPGTALTPKYW